MEIKINKIRVLVLLVLVASMNLLSVKAAGGLSDPIVSAILDGELLGIDRGMNVLKANGFICKDPNSRVCAFSGDYIQLENSMAKIKTIVYRTVELTLFSNENFKSYRATFGNGLPGHASQISINANMAAYLVESINAEIRNGNWALTPKGKVLAN